MTDTIQPSFASGEIGPALYGRVDLARYQSALKTCKNWVVMPTGGLRTRPGTRFIAQAKDWSFTGGAAFADRVRLIPFAFSSTQSFFLELGYKYLRVLTNAAPLTISNASIAAWSGSTIYEPGQTVTSGGNVFLAVRKSFNVTPAVVTTPGTMNFWQDAWVELPPGATSGTSEMRLLTPYIGDSFAGITNPDVPFELSDLTYTQSGDVLTLCHPKFPPMQLKRYSNSRWALEEFEPNKGPWDAQNSDQGVRLFASGVVGEVTVTAIGGAPFDAQKVRRYLQLRVMDFGTAWEPGKTIALKDIRFSDGKFYMAENTGATGTIRPTHSEGSATDGVIVWRYLHDGWGYGMITAVAGDGKSCTLDIKGRLPDSLVPSGATSVVPIAVTDFLVGTNNAIRLLATGHGVAPGTKFNGTLTLIFNSVVPSQLQDYMTKMRARLSRGLTFQLEAIDVNNIDVVPAAAGIGYSSTLDTYFISAGSSVGVPSGLAGITHRWSFGAWGSTTLGASASATIGGPGYPSSVGYHQQRFSFAGAFGAPQTFWASRVGDFSDFGESSPIQDDDPITFIVASTKTDAIHGMVPMGSLLLFTDGAEWALGSGSKDVLTPSNVFSNIQSYWGSSNLPPIGIGGYGIFATRKGLGVRDLAYDFAQDGYQGRDLAVMASHLLETSEIREWAYQQVPFSCVWMVLGDGTMLGMTYHREHEITAWHHHDFGGVVESICQAQEGSEDVVYFCVKRGSFNYRSTVLTITEEQDAGPPTPPNPTFRTILTAASATFSPSDVGRVVRAQASIVIGFDAEGTPIYGTGWGTMTVATYVSSTVVKGPWFTLGPGGQRSLGSLHPDTSSSNWYFEDDTTGFTRYIDKMTKRLVTSIRDAFFVDSGLTFDGKNKTATTITVTGASFAVSASVTLTASAATFVLGSPSTDIGDQIVWEDSAGVYRIQITAVTSTTVATGTILQALPTIFQAVARADWAFARDTISGLDHLIGKNVAVLADGVVQNQKGVVSGMITLDSPGYKVHVGLPITADIETLDITVPGGPVVAGKRITVPSVRVMTQEVQTLKVGRTFDLLDVITNTTSDSSQAVNLRSGVMTASVRTDWSQGGRVCIRQDQPLPATVLAIIPDVTIGGALG